MEQRLYALVNDNIVKMISLMTAEDIAAQSRSYQLFIDITDMVILPEVGWLLDGNKLVPPVQLSEQEVLEKILTSAVKFGKSLKDEMSVKIGARNMMLEKTEAQISVLVGQLASIGMLLEGGALRTAKTAIMGVKTAFPEYTAECDYAINKIEAFLG